MNLGKQDEPTVGKRLSEVKKTCGTFYRPINDWYVNYDGNGRKFVVSSGGNPVTSDGKIVLADQFVSFECKPFHSWVEWTVNGTYELSWGSSGEVITSDFDTADLQDHYYPWAGTSNSEIAECGRNNESVIYKHGSNGNVYSTSRASIRINGISVSSEEGNYVSHEYISGAAKCVITATAYASPETEDNKLTPAEYTNDNFLAKSVNGRVYMPSNINVRSSAEADVIRRIPDEIISCKGTSFPRSTMVDNDLHNVSSKTEGKLTITFQDFKMKTFHNGVLVEDAKLMKPKIELSIAVTLDNSQYLSMSYVTQGNGTITYNRYAADKKDTGSAMITPTQGEIYIRDSADAERTPHIYYGVSDGLYPDSFMPFSRYTDISKQLSMVISDSGESEGRYWR